MKNIVIEIKNLIDQLNCKVEMADERLSELEDTLQEITQNITHKEMKNMKVDQMSKSYLCLLRVPNRKKRELEANR